MLLSCLGLLFCDGAESPLAERSAGPRVEGPQQGNTASTHGSVYVPAIQYTNKNIDQQSALFFFLGGKWGEFVDCCCNCNAESQKRFTKGRL